MSYELAEEMADELEVFASASGYSPEYVAAVALAVLRLDDRPVLRGPGGGYKSGGATCPRLGTPEMARDMAAHWLAIEQAMRHDMEES